MSKKKERLVTDVNGNELFTDDWIKIVESIEIDCQEVAKAGQRFRVNNIFSGNKIDIMLGNRVIIVPSSKVEKI